MNANLNNYGDLGAALKLFIQEEVQRQVAEQKPLNDDEWLTTKQVAEIIKINENSVYALVRAGILKAEKPFGGRRFRFRRSVINDYLRNGSQLKAVQW